MSINPYQNILDNISRFVTLSEDEKKRLISIIRITRVKKRQYIDQPGFTSAYRNYVSKGAFRSFFIDAEGKVR